MRVISGSARGLKLKAPEGMNTRPTLDLSLIHIYFINFAEQDENLDFYSPVIIANNDYIKNNPEQAKAFVQAAKKGYEFAEENPKEAADILCENAPELDKDIVGRSQEWLADKYTADSESWGYIDPVSYTHLSSPQSCRSGTY